MKFHTIRAGFMAAAILATSISAQAADLGGRYKAPAYTAPAYFNWSGFYVGINAGYGWGKADWGAGTDTANLTGYLIGATLGYNYQFGSFVVGIEGDIDYSTVKGNCAIFACSTNMKYFGTGRARLGYAWDRWLPFITGGVAVANIENSGTAGSESVTKIGWTAGVGLEYAFAGPWSAKLEYLYADLGTTSCATCFGGGPVDVKVKVNAIRIGVNYRF